MPRFSIIVPVYKVEEFLDECVQSVLSQDFADFELILIDDGSPDRCGEMCDAYAKGDERVRVIHKENGGLAAARNSGLQIAQGEYIVFIDSDDGFSRNDALQTINDDLRSANEPDVALTENNFKLTENTGSKALNLLLCGKGLKVVVWDKVYRREFVENNKLRFIEGFVHEDLYWTPVSLQKAKSVCLTQSFIFHRENAQSITRSTNERSVLNRAVSKLNIANLVIAFFEAADAQIKSSVLDFYFGIYISGVLEGASLKSKEYKSLFRVALKNTKVVWTAAKKSPNKKHRLLSLIHRLFGIGAVKLLLKLTHH